MIMNASSISKKARRKRRNRDPTKPKRPLSAYMLYANEQRSTFRDQFPTEKLMEISKRIAVAWHALDDASRAKYTSQAAVAKKSYLQAMEVWKAQQPVKVKKPSTAYNFFMKETRLSIIAEHPSLTQCEIMTKVGLAWRNADDATKARFINLANEDKKRYKRETAAVNTSI